MENYEIDERNDREHLARLDLAHYQHGMMLKNALVAGKGEFKAGAVDAAWRVELYDEAKYSIGDAMGLPGRVMFVTRIVADADAWKKFAETGSQRRGEIITTRISEGGNRVYRMYLTLFLYPSDIAAGQLPSGTTAFDYMRDQKYWATRLFPQYWQNNRDVIIHELTHALDQLRIRPNDIDRNWKGQDADTHGERYLSDPLEFNAVFLEVADYMTEFYRDKPLPAFKEFLDHMTNPFAPNNMHRISRMDRWKKKVMTRAYQLWTDLRAAVAGR